MFFSVLKDLKNYLTDPLSFHHKCLAERQISSRIPKVLCVFNRLMFWQNINLLNTHKTFEMREEIWRSARKLWFIHPCRQICGFWPSIGDMMHRARWNLAQKRTLYDSLQNSKCETCRYSGGFATTQRCLWFLVYGFICLLTVTLSYTAAQYITLGLLVRKGQDGSQLDAPFLWLYRIMPH